jgi:predicted DCC family thiol-disulfide oxidoreductase YuxK
MLQVIYDGQCSFCVRSLSVLRRLDVLGRMRSYDANDRATLESRFPMLRGADVENAMYVVAENGRVYRGFFAFRRLIWSSPLTWLLIPLFYFPGSAFLGMRIYAWVAENRRRLGCESQVCENPTSSSANRRG